MKKFIAAIMVAFGLLASNYMGAEATDIAPEVYQLYLPVQKDMCFQVSNGIYQVTSATDSKRTVRYLAPADKNCTKVVIPATITLPVDGNVYQVTSIAAAALKDCENLRTVRIGSKVSYIGEEAFKNCKKLAKIEIPSNVTSMGAKVFSNCTSLKKVVIGNKLQKISNFTFYKCTALEQVVIGSGVKTIGTSAFSGCKKLKTVQINSKKLKTVNKNAFYGIQKKAVMKVPSSKVTAYKKLLKKWAPSTVTIKKK